MKTADFSFEACDLKVGRCRQLIEFMRVCEFEGQGHFLTLAQDHLNMKIKTCVSQKPHGRFQAYFVCKLLHIWN